MLNLIEERKTKQETIDINIQKMEEHKHNNIETACKTNCN